MKVTNLRRKLVAALAAAGMLSPAAACAANLNQNLVTNGDFETVDLNTTGSFNGPKILNWLGSPSGFAYSHDASSSSAGQVPDFANGTDPPNAGHWYFTSNNAGGPSAPRIDAPGKFYQDIDVSAGDSGDAIATGYGQFNLQAYMSTFGTDKDIGQVHLD